MSHLMQMLLCKTYPRGLAFFFSFLIGSEERDVPDIAGGKVVPLCFCHILSENYYIFSFFHQGLTTTICTLEGEPIEVCEMLQPLKPSSTDNVTCLCSFRCCSRSQWDFLTMVKPAKKKTFG